MHDLGVIDLPRDVKDVLVADPKIDNAVIRSTRRAYLIGVAVGQTNVYFFDAEGKQIAGLDIAVTRSPCSRCAQEIIEREGAARSKGWKLDVLVKAVQMYGNESGRRGLRNLLVHGINVRSMGINDRTLPELTGLTPQQIASVQDAFDERNKALDNKITEIRKRLIRRIL